MKRFRWKFSAWVGEIILWLVIVSLAIVLGSVMGRWAIKKARKTDTGAVGRTAVTRAALSEKVQSGARRFFEGPVNAQDSAFALPTYGRIPLSFEPNLGQAIVSVRYMSRNSNHSVFFMSNEVILQLPISGAEEGKDLAAAQGAQSTWRTRVKPGGKSGLPGFPSRSRQSWARLRMGFAGASPHVEVDGEHELSRRSNYLMGADPRNWKGNIPNYSRVHYRDLYPGIDLVFYGNQQQLEYDLNVRPGSDPRQVGLSLDLTVDGSSSSLRIEPQTGDLVLPTPGGEIRQKRPRAYQEIDGRKRWIACRYALDRSGRIGFDLGEYDPRSLLVIDPTLTYSAVGIGGNTIAVDSKGNAYVVGVAGTGFVTTPGAFQSGAGGGDCVSGPNTVPCADVLVAKLNPAGTDLVYSTFLGGNGADYGYGLAVDESGNVYLAGTTSSTNFPTTPDAFQPTSAPCAAGAECYSAFVAKLNDSGTQLIYSTYLSGSSGGISANAVAVDSSGCSYVTGDATNGGFVIKLKSDGSAPIYSFSGLGGAGIAVDVSGNAYVVGRRTGRSFVSKLSADGGTSIYNYRLGGTFPQYSARPEEIEGITGIAVDPLGYAYVTGYTAYSNFPTTPNAPFPAAQGVGICGSSICRDAFVSKLNTDGTGLVYSSYLGGSSVDYGTGIAVDLSGNAYVTGVTRSPDFPIIPRSAAGQKGGIFVSKMNAAGNAFLYSLTLGTGQTAESGNAIAADPMGNAYVTGTVGNEFPLIPGSYQTPSGGNGSFVARVFDEMTLFVPVVLSAAGQNGSFFSSELALTNRSASDVKIEYTYTAAFGGGSGKAVDGVQAGRQQIIPDTIAYLRNLGLALDESGSYGGTLRVRFQGLGSPSEAAVTVRTTTKVAVGRAGLAYPGISQPLALPAYLCGLRQNSVDRTNLAIQNVGTEFQGEITLRIEIYSSDPGIPTVVYPIVLEETLAPGEFKQITGILSAGDARVSSGFVRVIRLHGSAPYYAYAVVNDQSSSDGSYISPLAAGSLSGRKETIVPVVVETPQFSTEVVLTNYAETTKTLALSYVADNIRADSNTASVNLILKPHDQVILPSLVAWMRQRGAVGLPSGQSYMGPLFVAVEKDDLDGIFVGARTSTASVGGRYGVSYSAVPSGMTTTTSAWLYDFQQSATSRTNLGLVNTGETDGSADVFKLEVYDGDTGQLASTVEGLSVSARRLLQINSLLDKYASGTQQGYVRVSRTKGSNPFIAYSVINDGARPGEGSGDGAFVSSLP